MWQRKIGPGVTPAYLAAYLDGELDDRSRAAVQAWLAQHPHAAADLHAQRHLIALWQQALPPEPAPAVWQELLQRIERDVARRHTTHCLEKKRWWRRAQTLVPLLTAAAAVLVALVWLDPVPVPKPSAEVVEVFPVASSDEVEIISLEGSDHEVLIVGRPPLAEPMVLVAPGDAFEVHMEPDVDGMVPLVARVPDGLATMMVVAPLFWGGEDGKE